MRNAEETLIAIERVGYPLLTKQAQAGSGE